MKTVTVLSIVFALLAGCSATYCKPGATSQDFNRDKYECTLRARQLANFGDVYNPFEEVSALRECLEYKGYSKCSQP